MHDDSIKAHIQTTLKEMLPKVLEHLRGMEETPAEPGEAAMFEIKQSVETGRSLKHCTLSITLSGSSVTWSDTTWSKGGI